MKFNKAPLKILILAGLPLALNANHAFAGKGPSPADIAKHASGIWSLDPAGRMNRWIVIHNPAGGDESGVYRIEVLGSEAKAPVWKVKRSAPHMAATLDAILNSVRKPLQRGLVYPEQYNEDLSRWEKERKEGKARICATSIDRCLPAYGTNGEPGS